MVLKNLPRGVPGRDDKEHSTTKSRWADSHKVSADKDLQYDPKKPGNKIFLGAVNGQLIGIENDQHMITVAGSRAGKGTSVIIPNLLFYQGSMLVIDPKAELASITAEHRAKELGQRVMVLDPFNRAKPWVAPYKASFNPLTMLTEDSPTLVEDAGLLADALVVKSGKESHWDESARILITGVILHVATFPKYEGKRHLSMVRDLITKGTAYEGEEGISGLEMEMQNNDSADGEVLVAAADFFERPDTERLSVLSTARRQLAFLQYKAIRDVLEKHDFDLADLKKEPNGMTVYLCLPAGRLGTCKRWLRLFIGLALETMEREQKKPRHPVVLCLDEFAILGHMSQIEDAAGQIAGFGVRLWPILQDLTQLKALYKDRWETFLGNAGVLQFFGNNDITTLDFIEKKAGKTSFVVESGRAVTTKEREGGGTGTSWNTQVHSLVTAEEAGRIFARSDPQQRQVIFVAGVRPIILQRVNYYQKNGPFSPHFKGKYRVLE